MDDPILIDTTESIDITVIVNAVLIAYVLIGTVVSLIWIFPEWVIIRTILGV